MPATHAIIACAVLEMEIEHYARLQTPPIPVYKLPQGLHDDPPLLRIELQKLVDQVEQDPNVELIALGYGLCSRGTEEVRAKRCRIAIPRAHDCITLLLGSKEQYGEYVAQHPGTYWYSAGWNKHHIPPGKRRYEVLKAEYVEKYGEDNAEFLMETEQHWFSTYDRATFVEVGIGDPEPDVTYTQQCADWLGWKFDRIRGNPELIRDLVEARFDDERFLILQPGQSLRLTADDRVIEAVDAP